MFISPFPDLILSRTGRGYWVIGERKGRFGRIHLGWITRSPWSQPSDLRAHRRPLYIFDTQSLLQSFSFSYFSFFGPPSCFSCEDSSHCLWAKRTNIPDQGSAILSPSSYLSKHTHLPFCKLAFFVTFTFSVGVCCWGTCSFFPPQMREMDKIEACIRKVGFLCVSLIVWLWCRANWGIESGVMEEELVQLFQAASKAADAAAVHIGGCEDEESRCLDALKRLKSFPVTSQVLVSTQVRTSFAFSSAHCWTFHVRSQVFCPPWKISS